MSNRRKETQTPAQKDKETDVNVNQVKTKKEQTDEIISSDWFSTVTCSNDHATKPLPHVSKARC